MSDHPTALQEVEPQEVEPQEVLPQDASPEDKLRAYAQNAAQLILENLALAGLHIERDAFGRAWFLADKQPVARITPAARPGAVVRVRPKGQISDAHRAAIAQWIAAVNILESVTAPNSPPYAWCVPLGPNEVFSPKGVPMKGPSYLDALAFALLLSRPGRLQRGILALLLVLTVGAAALTR